MDLALKKGIYFDQARVQNEAQNFYMILSGNGLHNVGARSEIKVTDFADISQVRYEIYNILYSFLLWKLIRASPPHVAKCQL